eukprot:2802949-Rhodomonas_salina.1
MSWPDLERRRADLDVWTTTECSRMAAVRFLLVLHLPESDPKTRWVNGRVCPIDPFTETFADDCPKPIPDDVNTVEKTDFWVQVPGSGAFGSMVHISLLATTRLVPSNAAVFFPIAFTVPSLAPPLCHLATPSH